MKTGVSSQNQLTKQFLRVLDRQLSSKPTIDSIMQLPSTLYSTIKQMYNSFKKQNESHILQNKIYDFKIYEYKNKTSTKYTPVTILSLCQSYSRSNDCQNINNLIILKSYLPLQLQKQLIVTISKQILKLDNLSIVLKSFKKIFKTKQCLNDKSGLYKNIQNQMMNKLLNYPQFHSNQIKIICQFILSLPYLQKQIIQFIAQLFQKVIDIVDFDDLKIIYTNIYKKLQTQNTNDRLKQILLKSLMKITITQHLDKIKQLLQTIYQKIQTNQPLTQSNIKFLSLLQKQAKNKITINIKQKKQSLIKQSPLKQKQKKIIDFIFLSLETQSLVHPQNTTLTDKQRDTILKQSKKFWMHFISWYQLSSSFPAWKQYVTQHMFNLIHKILSSPKSAIQLIKILIQAQTGSLDQTIKQIQYLKYQFQPFSQLQNQNQNISNYFIRQLFSNISTYSKYLNNKSARKLIAICVMKDELQTYQKVILNQNNLIYIDILLQIFQLANPTQFFKKILSDTYKKTILQSYLTALLNQKPKKFKDFFMKIDSYNKGQIFILQQYCLLKFFQQNISSQLTISFLRDMTTYSPSKLSIQIINRFITKYKNKPQQKIIYFQSIRTLHIILSTRSAQQLPAQFKIHLKDIVQNKVISQQVFKNVPKQMIDDLAKFYNTLQAK